jgi:hypothetical protein
VIDCSLQLLFDIAEVQHHRLRVEFTFKFDIDDPAFADQATGGVEVGAVDDGELFYKETGHGGHWAERPLVYRRLKPAGCRHGAQLAAATPKTNTSDVDEDLKKWRGFALCLPKIVNFRLKAVQVILQISI